MLFYMYFILRSIAKHFVVNCCYICVYVYVFGCRISLQSSVCGLATI